VLNADLSPEVLGTKPKPEKEVYKLSPDAMRRSIERLTAGAKALLEISQQVKAHVPPPVEDDNDSFPNCLSTRFDEELGWQNAFYT